VAVTTPTVFVSSDVFKIVVEDLLVTFYLNNVEIYSEVKINTNDVYYLDSSLYYSGNIINDVRILQSIHTHTTEIVITGSVKFSGVLFSPNMVEIIGTVFLGGKITPYYGIFGSINFGGKLFSKNVVSINSSINFSGLIEQALIEPIIPISISGSINFDGYIRMPLRGKPIMFINT